MAGKCLRWPCDVAYRRLLWPDADERPYQGGWDVVVPDDFAPLFGGDEVAGGDLKGRISDERRGTCPGRPVAGRPTAHLLRMRPVTGCARDTGVRSGPSTRLAADGPPYLGRDYVASLSF